MQCSKFKLHLITLQCKSSIFVLEKKLGDKDKTILKTNYSISLSLTLSLSLPPDVFRFSKSVTFLLNYIPTKLLKSDQKVRTFIPLTAQLNLEICTISSSCFKPSFNCLESFLFVLKNINWVKTLFSHYELSFISYIWEWASEADI